MTKQICSTIYKEAGNIPALLFAVKPVTI